MSVKIIGHEMKINSKTKEPYSILVVQGSAEVLTSKLSGRVYISARTTRVPCALSDAQAKSLIGQELPGRIEKVEVDEFEVKLPNGKKSKALSVISIFYRSSNC